MGNFSRTRTSSGTRCTRLSILMIGWESEHNPASARRLLTVKDRVQSTPLGVLPCPADLDSIACFLRDFLQIQGRE
ncbi:hypothetical protein XPA_003298 [Xanthoria parietina]